MFDLVKELSGEKSVEAGLVSRRWSAATGFRRLQVIAGPNEYVVFGHVDPRSVLVQSQTFFDGLWDRDLRAVALRGLGMRYWHDVDHLARAGVGPDEHDRCGPVFAPRGSAFFRLAMPEVGIAQDHAWQRLCGYLHREVSAPHFGSHDRLGVFGVVVVVLGRDLGLVDPGHLAVGQVSRRAGPAVGGP